MTGDAFKITREKTGKKRVPVRIRAKRKDTGACEKSRKKSEQRASRKRNSLRDLRANLGLRMPED
jgi:hypothetical protein